jgi:Zn-dependent metalloprotease
MAQRQSPLFCILPPHMLEHIAENGSDAQRAKAVQTNRQTSDFRSRRQATPRQPAAPQGAAGRQRSVYNADHLTDLPGRLIRIEGGPPSGDTTVDEAYDGAGATYDLFLEIYQRNSLDGKGMHLDSTVHYQVGYDNAFWNGSQMVYGDGDEDLPPAERLFNRFTICTDVIAHELTHGITQFTANLVYLNQPGALNESFSDVFGSLAQQRSRGQTARNADWIIGKGLLTTNVNGVGLRSMKEPGTAYNDPVLGKDPQPGTMQGYVNTTSDNGGVHINSGIPNHAFYLTAYELDGYAWEKAGRIWYVTLRDRIGANTNFQEAANLTFKVAGELYGQNSLEQQAVGKGWAGVGITATAAISLPKLGCLGALLGLFGSR